MHKFSKLDSQRVYKPRRLSKANFYSGSTYDLATRQFVMLGDLTTSEYALGMGAVRQVAGAVKRRAGSIATSAARGIGGGIAKAAQKFGAVKNAIKDKVQQIQQSKTAQTVKGVIGTAKQKIGGIGKKAAGIAARSLPGRAVGRVAATATRVVAGVNARDKVKKAFGQIRQNWSLDRELLLLSDIDEGRQAKFMLSSSKGGNISPKKPGLLRKAAVGAVKVGFKVARTVAGAPGRIARGAVGLAVSGAKKVAGAAVIKGARKMLKLSHAQRPLLAAEFQKTRSRKSEKQFASRL